MGVKKLKCQATHIYNVKAESKKKVFLAMRKLKKDRGSRDVVNLGNKCKCNEFQSGISITIWYHKTKSVSTSMEESIL